jgi:hypothetical protein
MSMRLVLVVAFLFIAACAKGRSKGDHVMVEWKGSNYPAVITEVVSSGQYKIHYDGYGAEWDEVVGDSRILGTPK